MAAYINSGILLTRVALTAGVRKTLPVTAGTPAALANRLYMKVKHDAGPAIQLEISSDSAFVAGAGEGIPPGGEWWEPVGPGIALYVIADTDCTISVWEGA